MDQIRTILAWLKKQHFWVLTVLVALIALFCWWTAAGKLSKRFNENKQRITAGFTQVSGVSSSPFHPNATIQEKQEEERKKLAEEVKALWQELYDRQTEQVLEWPDKLSQEFRDYVDKLQFGQEIPQHLRNNYRDYADRYFPNLPEIIGARPLLEGEAGSGMGSPGGEFMGRGGPRGPEGGPGFGTFGAAGQLEEDDDNYICEWLDQDVIREKLNFRERPSSLLIWVTQEDLWVYKALLLPIKNVNEAAGATRKSNAAIRTIVSLEVGQRAAQWSRTPNRIYPVPTAAPAAADPMEMMGPEAGAEGGASAAEQPMPGRMEFSGGRSGDGTMSEAEEQTMLLAYRYLDDSGKPIPHGSAGMSTEGGEMAPPEAAAATPVDPAMFGKEYKRVPVRMVLVMDQRHLPHLIAQCASQSLQVEVNEVRINPPDAGGSSGGGMEGFRGGFGGGGGGSSSTLFPDRTGLLEFNPHPEIVNVVIQGVIYIFNKPDASVLESTDATQVVAN